MEETGCEQGEAELALEMCGFDVEKAVRAIPRLFHNIAVLKGKFRVEADTLYVLFLVILNLKNRSLLRARSVASFNPVVFDISFTEGWFEFEKHLYACRLRSGSVQPLSIEIEDFLGRFFASRESLPFYSANAQEGIRGRELQSIHEPLSRRFHPHEVGLVMHKDVLDLGQFQEIGGGSGGLEPAGRLGRPQPVRRRRPEKNTTLVLRISLDGSSDGIAAGDLAGGDMVHAQITDGRDIAQYLAKLFGAEPRAPKSLLVPVENIEHRADEVCIRVRFSVGVCGEIILPKNVRLKAARKNAPSPWWKKLWGDA